MFITIKYKAPIIITKPITISADGIERVNKYTKHNTSIRTELTVCVMV